jgi:quercetin dioxygenase-like cupin family protein
MGRKRGFGRWAVTLVVAALLAALVFGPPRGDARQATPAAAAAATPVVSSQILGTGLPPAALGQTIYLYRVMVEPGARIVPHTHPGTQVAAIVAGELTYTVIQGEVTITRAANGGTPGPTVRARSGHEVVLRPGDALVEHAGMIHHARNDGGQPVVILIASLFATGEPLSRAAPIPATPTT